MSRPKKVDMDLKAYLRKSPERRGLAEGALLIARQEYPRLDQRKALASIAAMARGAAARLSGAVGAREKIRRLNGYFFGELGFRGNQEEYFDPRNSYLPDVMERKLGIPITLSVLYLECAWASDCHLVGVLFPGHFLVASRPEFTGGESLYIDVFREGVVLDGNGLRELLRRSAGGEIELDPERHLRISGTTEILCRMLSNLKAIHMAHGQVERALWNVEWALLLRPDDWESLKDKGMFLFSLGRLREAEQALLLYLEKSPGSAGFSHAWQVLYAIRAQDSANLN